MPTYNSLTDRDEAGSLIPEEVEAQIFTSMEEQSIIMQLGTRLPNGSRNKTRLKVNDTLPSAYFVEGDTGLIQTSEMSWADKYVYYEKIGVIVPIPDDVSDDMDVDFWGEAMPKIAGAFAKKFDAGVLEGTDIPVSYLWPSNIAAAAATASHSVDLSTVVGASGDLYDAILSEGGTLGLLEADGFEATGHIAALNMKAKLRGLRGSDDHPIFKTEIMGGVQSPTQYSLDGAPIYFPKNGCLTPASNLMISGDFKQLVYSVRREMTFKILDQAVITDANGAVIYNFAQQEMKGLRVTMRIGWQIPNPVNRANATEATRYPFVKLVP